MKKIILTLAVAITTMCSFAGDVKVSSRVLNAFKTEFASAKEVSWTANTSYYKAAFVFNEQHVSAFYNAEGELMGLTRNISSLDLPIRLQADLKKDYNNYWISDLFEVSNSDGTGYYITLESADAKVVLKAANGESWKTYQKKTKA